MPAGGRQSHDSFGDGQPLQLLFASATSDAPAVRRSASRPMPDPSLIRLPPPATRPAARAIWCGPSRSATLPNHPNPALVLPNRNQGGRAARSVAAAAIRLVHPPAARRARVAQGPDYR